MEHIHKLIKIRLNPEYAVFKCVKPCTFFINSKLVFGYQAECWRCSKPFVLGKEEAKQKKPHCKDCTRPRNT